MGEHLKVGGKTFGAVTEDKSENFQSSGVRGGLNPEIQGAGTLEETLRSGGP